MRKSELFLVASDFEMCIQIITDDSVYAKIILDLHNTIYSKKHKKIMLIFQESLNLP